MENGSGARFQKIALPSGKFVVRDSVLFRVGNARGVGGELPDRDLRFQGISAPARDVFRGQVVGGDSPVAHRYCERHAADQGLGHRGGAVRAVRVPPGRVPFKSDASPPNHDEARRAVGREVTSQGVELRRVQACFGG